MSCALFVLWTITPSIYPQPLRSCSRCGGQRPFRCSGKFRLNANGKRLDAWLVYKCSVCDDTWNRTVVERRATGELDSAMLAAFETNDQALVRRYAFDVAALRRTTRHVEEFPDVDIRKEPICVADGAPSSLKIALTVPFPSPLRLDRLLASELGLSRSRIVTLTENGELTATAALNKAVHDGTVVVVSRHYLDSAT